MKHIKTSDTKSIKALFKDFHLPKSNSHKGQNGKVLIIGGSSLFHAASIWAAEVTSHFADIVHYSSTKENNEIVLSLKKKFVNGIVIPHGELDHYLKEDDAVLLGPGMVRGKSDEAEFTRKLTKEIIQHYPDKKFVFDAGSLQMMEPEWLKDLHTSPILTPHQIEFELLFGLNLHNLPVEEKIREVKEIAKRYKSIILLKAIVDIISDGEKVYVVEGGNAGLTKGGTGDVLGGLCVSFFAKEQPLESALYASILLKRTAERLFKMKGYWYNIDNLIQEIPNELKHISIG
jgi:NAD(P)H-hydrate epimerase